MKALFHCYEFPPQAGGVGSYIHQMSCALSRMGHESIVVTSRSPGLPEFERGECGTIHRIYDRAELRAPRVAEKVLEIARSAGVDVIEGADHHGELALLARARNRPPVMVKIHGSNPIRVVNDSQVLFAWQRLMIWIAIRRNWRQTLAERRSIEWADMATVPSRRLLSELQKQGLRLPARTAVLPYAIMPVPDAVGGEAAAPTVLLPARLEIRKGVQFLPQIVADVCTRVPGTIFEIAGADYYARGIGSLREWLVRQLGPWQSQVRFLGTLQADGMDAALRRSWVVILPSRWDNFPVAVLEAMVRARPVVTTPHGGMPEMLEGTLSETVDPGSPAFSGLVAALLSDPVRRAAVGASLRRKALDAYSPDRIAKQFVDFVGTASASGSPRANTGLSR